MENPAKLQNLEPHQAKTLQSFSLKKFNAEKTLTSFDPGKYVVWSLKITPFYRCKEGSEEEVESRGSLTNSPLRTILFSSWLFRSAYVLYATLKDIILGDGKTTTFTTGIRGIAIGFQLISLCIVAQLSFKMDDLSLTYNRFQRLRQSLEARGSFYSRRYWQKRQLFGAAVITTIYATLPLAIITYLWLRKYRPGSIPSPLENYFDDSPVGWLMLILEILWSVYALIYGYLIVTETVMLGGFAGNGFAGLIYAMKWEAPTCVRIHEWEEMLSIHEKLRLLLNDFNALVNPIFIPGALPLATFIMVILNYGTIRITLRKDMIHRFGITPATMFAAICSLGSAGIFFALEQCSKVPRTSKQVLKRGRQCVSAMLESGGDRSYDGMLRARVLQKRLRGIKYLVVENAVDGPMTELAGLYFLANVAEYTCSLLLAFNK